MPISLAIKSKLPKKMKKLSFRFILAISLFFVLLGCESNRYRSAVSSYYNGNYTISIEEIDSYLREAKNGAYKTNAELIRSKSYQQLALRAYSSKNLALATRFSLLANSEATDSLLARCYYDYAQLSFESGDKEKGFEFLEQILLEIPDSRFTSEIIYTKMNDSYNSNPDNYLEAWEYYKQLYPEFKDDPFEIQSRDIVANFSQELISDALQADSQAGLDILLEFIQYTVGNTSDAKEAIAQIYINLAEEAITEKDFVQADTNFKSAVYYDASVLDFVKQRLLDTAEQYIIQGREYAKQRDFENAFTLFNRTFDVIPGYKKALEAIQETTIQMNNIEEAKDIYIQAQQLEKTNLRAIFPDIKLKPTVSERNDYEIRRFQRILGLYEKAYKLDPLSLYQQQILYTKNIIRFYKEPEEFAKEIIRDYNSFIVEKAIKEAKAYLLANNPTSRITDSGWEVLVASGNYNYEIRYSLLSFSNKFYFRWIINLRTKDISPINSLSEQAMTGKFVLTEEDENENID